MNTSLNKPTSLFDQIADAVKPYPEFLTAQTNRIIGISYETTIDKIIAILSISWHRNGTTANYTDVKVIEHDDFHAWCEEEGKLIEESGPVDDPTKHEIGYHEFMTSHLDSQDILQYLQAKKLIDNYVISI